MIFRVGGGCQVVVNLRVSLVTFKLSANLSVFIFKTVVSRQPVFCLNAGDPLLWQNRFIQFNRSQWNHLTLSLWLRKCIVNGYHIYCYSFMNKLDVILSARLS